MSQQQAVQKQLQKQFMIPADIWWPTRVRLEEAGGKHVIPFEYWVMWHHQFLIPRESA